jgi:hypothetical protein
MMTQRGGRRWMTAAFSFSLLAIVIVAVAPRPTRARDVPRLAVLIAAPWEGERAMSQDMLSMADAVKQRGWPSEQIMTLEGVLTRNVLLDFIGNVSRRIASLQRGDVFFAVSAHGMFHGTTAADARPGLLLSDGEPASYYEVFWDEIFDTLQMPPGVRLILLPDS